MAENKITDVEVLEDNFKNAVYYSTQSYFEFEEVFNKILNNRDSLDDNQLNEIKVLKKKLEADFKNYISEYVPKFETPNIAGGYKQPITEDNFEYNMLNCYAVFKERLHNKINSKAKNYG